MPKRPDPQLKIIEQDRLAVVEEKRRSPIPPTQPVAAVPVIDSRWLQVQEFLRAKGIAPTTSKAYEGELQRFGNWTDKA